MNVVTRLGTNDLRGSGFFLFRDQSMMARSPYADRSLPAATADFSTATRQFLAANNIPLSLFGAGGSIRQVRPEFVDVHNLTAKINTQLSNTQSLTGRYQLTNDTQPSGQSFGDWKPGYPGLTNLSVTGGFDLGGSSTYPQGQTDWIYQVIDNYTGTLSGTRTGEHAVNAGAQVMIFESESFFDSNFRGTYTFPSLNAFVAGTPSRFTQNQGDSKLARPNQIYGFYLQDDWRPSPSLTINTGVRYDYEGAKTEALKDVTGSAGPGVSRDRNNLSPRFGFSWAPGDSTTQAIYGGSGIYYDQVILNVIGNARFTPPKIIGIQIDNPGFPNPFGGAQTVPTPSLSVIDDNLVTPWNWNTQLGYRRELTRDLGLF